MKISDREEKKMKEIWYLKEIVLNLLTELNN